MFTSVVQTATERLARVRVHVARLMNTADDVGAEVDVDVEEPAELLLDPVEPDLALPPEQWEVIADDPEPPLLAPQSVPDAPDRGARTEEAPEREESEAPPVAVPVLHHIVEAPVFEPAPMPESEPEPEPEPEEEPDFEVLAPVTASVLELEPVAPVPPPAALPVSPAPAPFVAEQVPPAERATSAMVLLLLAVVVGIALAGLVSAVVLVLTLLVRRALGA